MGSISGWRFGSDWTLRTFVLLCALAQMPKAEISVASRPTGSKIPQLRASGEPMLLKRVETTGNSLHDFPTDTFAGQVRSGRSASGGDIREMREESSQLYSKVQRSSHTLLEEAGATGELFAGRSDGQRRRDQDKSVSSPGAATGGLASTRRRDKRSGPQTPESLDRVHLAGAVRESSFSEGFPDAYKQRSDFRRPGTDGPLNSPRLGEPHLVTSTFALSGDSAHNQAMVLWSGHNSSVILILTKLYDFNLGAVTESSLWRSADSGATYEKLNDRVGSRTMLSYLYVCPTNKRKILILSDPEVESSILVSSDEGTTFQKFSISFYILSLLFHPGQENWLLAFSHDHKLYSSMDFGRNWILVHELVTPNRFYWAMTGLDKEADLVHMEARTANGYAQYVTCKAQRCSEGEQHHPFSGRIDTNSLVVQDEYVFVQVTTAGRAKYFVSYQREPFKRMQLPKYCLPKDMHIISTDEKQVYAAVQEWNENDTYSLYISDRSGVYLTRSLPHLRTGRSPAGNLVVDIYKVTGINGMFIANRKEDNQLRTYVTYNKGQTWRLLQAPVKDLAGNDISCSLPSCSLHLHLQMSENPYTPDTISTKASAPGIIVATGNIGPELTYSHIGMFISSDAGNTWRQIFEEEHNVWFLDHGGALLAVMQASVPIRHLWISLDEGRRWDKHSFSSTPLFVDGVLMEQETENHIITFFGHFSYRSDWQLIKIDYRAVFSRRCTDGDYQTWHLHNKGEACVMGERQIFMKRKPGNRCLLGQEYPRVISADPCLCTVHDFECDYGFERQANGKCSAAFWYRANMAAKGCSPGQHYYNSTGYRKVLSNNCKEGLKEVFSPRVEQCQPRAPSGLQLSTSDGQLSAKLGANVSFTVSLQEGDAMKTSVRLDFGDGISVSYSNLSRLGDGIKHVYRNVGLFRVTAHAQNTLGSDSSSLFLHISSPAERLSLSAPVVSVRGQEANLTAVVWPSQPHTLVFYWWFNNSTEPLVTLEGSVSHTFVHVGVSTVTVQVSSGNAVLQDTRTVTVKEFFRSVLLSFSPNLEEHNPAVADWRQDVGRVVKATLSQVSGFPKEQLLVAVFPGSPTAAELFILPESNGSQYSPHLGEQLEKMSEVFVNALNQNLIQFDLKPDTRITVFATQLTLAPLVHSSPLPSGSAMLLLLSLAVLGLAVFFIYKFKRKIPWIHVHTEDTQEKEPEAISAVGQGESTPHTPHHLPPPRRVTHTTFSQPPAPRERVEKELEARNGGNPQLGCGEGMRNREIPNCTNV